MSRNYGAWATPPAPIPAEAITRKESADVLVLGAGMAGVACALRAAEMGAKVIVLEKMATWSGRGGNIGVANSSFMKSQGIENDPAVLTREWVKRCANRCDEAVVWRFMHESPRAMDWLLDIVQRPDYNCRPALNGSHYVGDTYYEYYGSHRFFGGPMEKKGARSGGPDSVNAMYSEAVKLGVQFIFSTPAEQLIKEDGRVVGAYGKSSDGYIEVRASRGVVLATGDISGNEDMCDDLCPDANKCPTVYFPKGGNMGDGHKMGYWAGGSFDDGPFPMILHTQAYHFRNYGFLYVKPDGKRFMNEDTHVQGKSVAVIREREQYAWSIMDANWPEQVPESYKYGGGLFWSDDYEYGNPSFVKEDEEKMLNWGLQRGVVVQADTPEELAEKMGVPADTFAATLARYNELAKKGVDEDFGKRSELMMPINKAPYYAMKFGPAVLAVVGGFKVDREMHVLDANGDAVEGLYAIGNTSGGKYGVDYPLVICGNSHGTALTFGFLVGEQLGSEK